MKKKLTIMFCLLILVAITIPAIAAAPVYSKMSDKELWNNYTELTREMVSRGLLTENDIVFTSETVSQSNIYKSTKTYVLNTNTHKIHMPGCSSVGDMKEKNKEYVEGDINTWLNKGYDRCKKCNPQ